MLIGAIRPGNKLNIKQLDAKIEKEYYSKLLDIKEEGIISIAMPIEKNKIVLLDIGSCYQVTFYTEKGLYTCRTEVIQHYKIKNIYIAELRVLNEAKKIQRREFFRFHCIMDMEYCVIGEGKLPSIMKQINKDENTSGWTEVQKKNRALELLKTLDTIEEIQQIEMKQGIIIDISGGGMKFRSEEKLDPKTEIQLSFTLNEGISKICIFGEIIASEKSHLKNNLYENRVKFTGISREDREEIVQYVLREQLKLRQKEKGFS